MYVNKPTHTHTYDRGLRSSCPHFRTTYACAPPTHTPPYPHTDAYVIGKMKFNKNHLSVFNKFALCGKPDKNKTTTVKKANQFAHLMKKTQLNYKLYQKWTEIRVGRRRGTCGCSRGGWGWGLPTYYIRLKIFSNVANELKFCVNKWNLLYYYRHHISPYGCVCVCVHSKRMSS